MIVGGRFQVESVIGRGDVGEVYRVKDPKSGLSYVLKLFTTPAMQDPNASGAFDRASRQSGQIAQEFVALQELGMDPNGPFTLLPAVSTRSLDRYIEKKGPLSPSEMAEFMGCLAPALDRAHASGLVHGDLKPQNVFFGTGLKGPVVRVTDFGVASLRMAAPAPWPCAYGWGAPEQVGGTPLMATMDVYSCALLAFFAMVGRPIFFALKLPTPEPQRLWEEMHTLPAASDRAAELGGVVSPVFDEVFRRALAPDPGARFQSVGELAQELTRAARSSQEQMLAVAAPAAVNRGPVVPPAMVSGSPRGAMHGTQVLTDDAVAKARAEIDALLAAKRAESESGPASVPMPVPLAKAPPPVGAVAPPPVVSAGIGAPAMVSGNVAPPPVMAGGNAPPAVVAPPPVVSLGIAPPPVVADASFDALGATNAALGGGGGGGNKRKVHGTMVADASEAFAMLESMAQAGAAAPPAAPPPVALQGKAPSFGGGGPIQPALVTGGSLDLGSTTADGGKGPQPTVQRPPPDPLGMSQLGMPPPEARRDATIIYTPPSSKNTKMIVIVVAVLLLVFGLGAGLIAWLLSMDSGSPAPESSYPALEEGPAPGSRVAGDGPDSGGVHV